MLKYKYMYSEEILELDEDEAKAYLQVMMDYQKLTIDDVKQLWENNYD